MNADDPSKPRAQPVIRPTIRLDAADLKPSWPIAIASLEQLADWATLALRLGTLALIQECVRELAQRDAKATVVSRLRYSRCASIRSHSSRQPCASWQNPTPMQISSSACAT